MKAIQENRFNNPHMDIESSTQYVTENEIEILISKLKATSCHVLMSIPGVGRRTF